MSLILNPDFDLKKLKTLSVADLNLLAGEIRAYLKKICGQNGGHLAGNLGAVELTLALHYVFNSPDDKLIFDVGHQSYTHKILTDRYQALLTLRQKGGLCGFTHPQESPHDINITGHAGNALSIATGLSLASPENCKIAIVGDGCLLNGMSIEALNHLATTRQNVLLIINDNGYSIDRCAGAIAKNDQYQALIESFNLPYAGPIDGHDLRQLIATLKQLKKYPYPRVLHLKTQKGKGDEACEQKPAQMHFYQEKPPQKKSLPKLGDYVAQELLTLARTNYNLHLVTPAMSQGGSLVTFAQEFPERFYDVGIAESHALGLSAGLVLGGKKVFCHLYASFMQRAYDQLIHDIALPKLPVTILLDRSGLVGHDGATHQGALALNFLNLIPNLEILNPGDSAEIKLIMSYALKSEKPSIIMYPRVDFEPDFSLNSHKKISLTGSMIQKSSSPVLVISTGWLSQTVKKATSDLALSHYHLPLIKPFPKQKISHLINNYQFIVVAEENSFIGGLGQMIAPLLSSPSQKLIHLALPDQFITHASREEQLEQVGLNVETIKKRLQILLAKKKPEQIYPTTLPTFNAFNL